MHYHMGDGKTRDVLAGASSSSCTFVARSNQISHPGATLPGFGFHQQSFSLGPPTGLSAIVRQRQRHVSYQLPPSVSLAGV